MGRPILTTVSARLLACPRTSTARARPWMQEQAAAREPAELREQEAPEELARVAVQPAAGRLPAARRLEAPEARARAEPEGRPADTRSARRPRIASSSRTVAVACPSLWAPPWLPAIWPAFRAVAPLAAFRLAT